KFITAEWIDLAPTVEDEEPAEELEAEGAQP
ncbi:hypothetical protein LCGC14_2150470, partial [marine sediment metagenome]